MLYANSKQKFIEVLSHNILATVVQPRKQETSTRRQVQQTAKAIIAEPPPTEPSFFEITTTRKSAEALKIVNSK